MQQPIQTVPARIVAALLLLFLTVAPSLHAQVTINATTFTVGASSGNNTVVTNWIGAPFSVNAPIYIYHTGNNNVTVSNFVITSASPSYLGFGTSNNVLTLLANTTWNLVNNTLYVGERTTSGNGLVVNGGVVSNLNLYIGSSLSTPYRSISNQVIVQNGGILTNVRQLVLGHLPGGEFNSLIVTNGGRFIQTAGDFLIGGGFNGAVGGGNNTAILSNSMVTITGASNYKNIGSGSSNNTVSLLANTVWDQGNTPLTIGYAAATGNSLTINGGIFSNASAMTVGAGGAVGNMLSISNGASFNSGNVVVGDTVKGSSNNAYYVGGGVSTVTVSNGTIAVGGSTTGAGGNGHNKMIVTNANLKSSTLTIGATGSGGAMTNNSVTVLANSTWNLQGSTITIGSGGGANTRSNSLTVNGGILTNGANLFIGTQSAAFSAVLITNGGQVKLNGTVYVQGQSSGSGSNNSLVVTGPGSVLTVPALYVDWNANAFAANNSVLVSDGGLVEANTLAISWTQGQNGGIGNTISNRNGIYQFTVPSPTIYSQSPGDVAITDGTISFRGIDNADVTNNLGKGALSKMVFAGANTFLLNAASNNIAGQGYTFAQTASPSNYVNLVLVNGATAYRGGNVTIGDTGSFLASNTLATITGNFTNAGTAAIVEATVNFQSALHVAGTLTLRNGFVTGSAAKTIAGTLRGNGAVVGDTTITGDLSPGLSLGTLVFSNNLTLAGSYQAEFGDGGNDQLVVVGDLTLSGATLDLTMVGGLTGEAYVIANYGDLFGTFSVTNGMPVGYTLDYNYTGANQIAIVVVPEPGPLALVVFGLVALGTIYHYRRA
ncbi:MAG: hypothetical protein PCFJNLEI_00971 [Verrucomicrobiae bacterium]|nr:hypothetical protein [Verrucomicrobiae bacterium]